LQTYLAGLLKPTWQVRKLTWQVSQTYPAGFANLPGRSSQTYLAGFANLPGRFC